jgi:hypothetical protein
MPATSEYHRRRIGGDSMIEIRANYDNFLATARRLPL